MSNHTPAPWFIDEEDDICGASPNTNGGESTWVAMGCCEETGIDFKSAADRALILAAPDMYEALSTLYDSLEFGGNYAEARLCEAVLRKARGEQ